MIRVLHVVGALDPGGTQSLLLNVYRHIDRSKVQFDFLVHSSESGFYDDEIRSLGGRVFSLPKPRLDTLPAYGRRLRDLIQRKGPFVALHSHLYTFSGYILYIASRSEVPLRMAHSHTTSDGKPGGYWRKGYRQLMRMLILRSATHLFACSEPASLSLFGNRALVDPRVTILPNAIDLAPFRDLPPTKQALREELALPVGSLLLGHIGSFRRQKNHVFLIEVMASLLASEPFAQLLLVGDGPLQGDVARLVEKKGIADHVHFLGLRSDVARYLGALDLFLFPSLYEGLGIVLIEAQAAGIPCITSDAIPTAADVGLGLVTMASLTQNVDCWATLIAGQPTCPPIPWPEREAALRRAGYDIQELAQRWQEIYIYA
jgi:glycosyltransferase EpsF